MNPALLQKQLRDNSKDLHDFCNDLKSWGDEMKRKEQSLIKHHRGSGDHRTKKKGEKSKTVKPSTKIGATDYDKWSKFDVDTECNKLDESEDEDSDLTDEHDEALIDESLVQKEKGNKLVKEQKWSEAIVCYTKAIECNAFDPIFYANRALCYLKIGSMEKAEQNCNLSLDLDKTYVKAYQRRAAAREALNKLDEAYSDLLKVLELEPNNNESKNAIDKLKAKIDTKPEKTDEERPLSKFAASRGKTKQTTSTTTKIQDVKPEILNDNKDVILIQPIDKPVHLRSKKPLKRIEIIETTSQIIAKPQIQAIKQNVVEKIQHKSVEKIIIEDKQNITIKLSETNQATNKINITQDNLTKKIALETPKNSVQFHQAWKQFKTSQEKYEYLKNIVPEQIPTIFQESMETGVFSGILETLATHFVENKDGVYAYLIGLTGVKRFGAFTLFMDEADKNRVLDLVNYVQTQEDKSKEDINILIKKYEL